MSKKKAKTTAGRKKPVKKQNTTLKKLIKYSLGLMTLGVLTFVGFVIFVAAGLFGPVPTAKELSEIKNNLATEIYSTDGKVIGRYFLQQRTPTRYENISPHVIDALVATEDARFFEHKGVDYRSLLRVIIKTFILQDRSGGGGSTISQQLAKNLYPRENNNTFYLATRKVKEALTAYRLENVYSKEEILTLYLNTVPFGENIYGIEMAANRFFSKSAADLEVHEAAVIVGMLKANHTYNPRLFPENALFRRNVVLNQMQKYDRLSADSAAFYKEQPLALEYKRIDDSKGSAAYFREQLRSKVEAWCKANTKEDGSPYNMYTDGLKVHTTIDSRIQTYAENAVAQQMQALQQAFDNHWGNAMPWEGKEEILQNAIRQSPHYQKLKQKGLSHAEVVAEMKKTYPMEVFTWEGKQEKTLSPIDSIKHYLKFLHTGVVAMDPNTGEVKAWVGGIDHEFFKYDHAKLTTKRQVGSTFKPFVYAAALEKGIDPCDYVSARKTTYTNLANWSPDNADTTENELKYSFEGALAQSVNTVSIKVLEKVGIEPTLDLASRAGIESDLPPVASVALGTADISLVEMATAYSSFANGGQRVSPYFITKITDKNGEVLYEATPPPKTQVMQPQTATMMNHLLTSVVDKGTAGRLRWKYNLTNDVAGKTGTTQSNADGWFIGYNPALVMAVWVGADNPGIRFRSTALGSGANTALPVFAETLKQINSDKNLRYITNATFAPLPENLQARLDCEISKEDKNFFERLLNTDLTKKEKEKKFKGEEEKEKKGFFKKIGDLFKKDDGS
ncbi:MAG: PBP1A family penicillin-binding protein [Fulvivirga sp.]